MTRQEALRHTTDLGSVLIQARDQVIYRHNRTTLGSDRRALYETAERLDIDASSIRLWKSNYMSRLYLIRMKNRQMILKIITGKPAYTASNQFSTLKEIYRVAERSGFRSPEPIVLIDEFSAFVMSRLYGESLSSHIAKRRDPRTLWDAASAAGRALASIHASWPIQTTPSGWGGLSAQMIEVCPWSTRDVDRDLLKRAGDLLSLKSEPARRLYGDLDAVNVLLDARSKSIGFVDPPDDFVIGPFHWDLAVFTLGVDRSSWRRPWTTSSYSPVRESVQRRFISSYFTELGLEVQPEDALAIAVCEAARLIQLALFWRKPSRYSEPKKAMARYIYTRPLIRAAWRTRLNRMRELIDD